MTPESKPLINRLPTVSGRFYSAHSDKLEVEITGMLSAAHTLCNNLISEENELLALISPHAGYVFSGIVAASAFMHLEYLKPRKRVFLIGSSHHSYFNGVSIYNLGHYITPFGKIKVDLELVNTLIEESDIINFVSSAHDNEHSIEVQLPFIQYFWKNNFEIIPIIIASNSKELCRQLSNELKPYFNNDNLFIISTDLSHYPEYTNALKLDQKTVESVLTQEPKNLLKQIESNKHEQIHNFDTSMCGWTSVLTLMYLTESIPNIAYKSILYQNSGDNKQYGNTDNVVGYQSVVILHKQNNNKFALSTEEKQILLNTANKSIRSFHKTRHKHNIELKNLSKNLLAPGGAFVSIYIDNKLRGCIGRMHSTTIALIEIVSEIAVSAAFFDNRFAELRNDEIDRIEIEISILTPMRKINNINEIELGKHGIYIKKNYRSGTFLPQVADNTQWTVEEFVGNCSKNKAGLGWNGWKNAELFIYEAIVFKV